MFLCWGLEKSISWFVALYKRSNWFISLNFSGADFVIKKVVCCVAAFRFPGETHYFREYGCRHLMYTLTLVYIQSYTHTHARCIRFCSFLNLWDHHVHGAELLLMFLISFHCFLCVKVKQFLASYWLISRKNSLFPVWDGVDWGKGCERC